MASGSSEVLLNKLLVRV